MSQTKQITSQPPEYNKLYICQPGTPPTEETCELPNENGEPDGDGVIRAEPVSHSPLHPHTNPFLRALASGGSPQWQRLEFSVQGILGDQHL